jgi:hypothetical protein
MMAERLFPLSRSYCQADCPLLVNDLDAGTIAVGRIKFIPRQVAKEICGLPRLMDYSTPLMLRTFVRLAGVQELHAFGFGKSSVGADYPGLYLVGTIEGIRGIFRSDAAAQTWERINDPQHQWGLILLISGDPKQYGRVYVGTHGRGIVYGDIIKR